MTADRQADDVANEAGAPLGSGDIGSIINIEQMEARVLEHRDAYQSAEPYEHIVLDDVLPPDVLASAYAELADMDSADWNSYLHYNERKYSNTDIASWGPALRSIEAAFASDRFISFLEQISGFDGLHADESLDGGGIHRSYRGGFLNMHADFTAHHTIKTWRRRVNLLLYLNPVWDEAWGGDLELWDADMSRCVSKVAPIGNRILLFTTGEHSFHGHPEPLQSPDGIARQSLALYYFTEESNPLAKSTDYRPRPAKGDNRFLIFADAKALAVYDFMKRRMHLSDDAVRRVMSLFSRRQR
ncbi:MAG: 2OG-Fe(II) oxygenase [Ilumatobacteraceae bacterium]